MPVYYNKDFNTIFMYWTYESYMEQASDQHMCMNNKTLINNIIYG